MSCRNDDNHSYAEICNQMAAEYDRNKDAQGWRGPEVIFGLMYAFISPGDSLLDIGIGTGLGSLLFYKAGLRVYGMDMAPGMLKICAGKAFTEDLKVHDLKMEPYPYSASSMNHAVCIGVMNHFEDLRPVFREVSRILKNNGVFGFIVADRCSDEESHFLVEHKDSQKTMFRHSRDQVGALLENNEFEFLREVEFAVPGHKDRDQPMRLRAYAAKRIKVVVPSDAGMT